MREISVPYVDYQDEIKKCKIMEDAVGENGNLFSFIQQINKTKCWTNIKNGKNSIKSNKKTKISVIINVYQKHSKKYYYFMKGRCTWLKN